MTIQDLLKEKNATKEQVDSMFALASSVFQSGESEWNTEITFTDTDSERRFKVTVSIEEQNQPIFAEMTAGLKGNSNFGQKVPA